MTISLALNNALSGLRAAQSSLAVISNNVSNVNTEGYTRKIQTLQPQVGNSQGLGVRTGAVARQVDEFLRRDLRRETSSMGLADVRDTYLSRLQDLLGNTADGGFIPQKLSTFAAALDAYAASPELSVNQANVIHAAEDLTHELNRTSTQIQTMRFELSQELGVAVDTVNSNLLDVERLNRQILRANALGQSTGDLMDQRDLAVSKIAEQMDIQTFVRNTGEMVVYTRSGRTLVDGIAQTLSYSTPSNLGFTSDLPEITFGPKDVDITSEFTGGRIAGFIEAGNTLLPNATAQLNTLAETLYGNPGRTTGVGDPASVSLEIDVTAGAFGVGDTLTSGTKTGVVTGVANLGNGQSRITVRSTAGTFASGDTITSGAGATADVTGVIASEPYGRLDTGTTSPSTTQKTLDLRNVATTPTVGQTVTDGTTTATITAVYYDSTNRTARVAIDITAGTGFTRGTSPTAITIGATTGPELIAINDSSRLFGNVDLTTSGVRNNAANITVHPDLVGDRGGDPGLLYLANDPSVLTLAQQLADSLKNQISFALSGALPATTTNLAGYASAIVSNNATLSSRAEDANKFQTEYQLQLKNRSAEIDGVNIDEEMANMVLYQNAYGASARVIDTANKLFDTLLSLGA